MHMNLFFDHYFNFLSAKTKINKNVLNLINLDGLEAFKRQTPGAWLEIWVNHFWFDVIWRTSQLFLKLHSHNSVLALLQHFCAFQVFVFGCRAQKENPEITENLYFTVFFLKLYQICFCVSLSLFLLPEFVIPLFNCYFCDFRGFRDFRVFDLADIDSYTDENTAFLCKRYVFCNYSTSESIHDTWYETIMRKLILENSCSVKLQYSNSSFF